MKASELLANFRYLCWDAVASNVTAKNGYGYLVDASTANVTVTLPSSPKEGDTVAVCDAKGQAQVNTIVIDGNGNKIDGSSSPYAVKHNRDCVLLCFSGGEWYITSQRVTGIGQDFPVKVNVVGGDYVLILDSEDGDASKRVLVSNFMDAGFFT